jgi:hypothetical protein
MSITAKADAGAASRERCRVAHAWLNAECYELLELEAERLGLHPDQLAARILGVTLLRSLVDGVLDHAHYVEHRF